jgi:hypothetical protein
MRVETGRPVGRPQGNWEDLRKTTQQKIMREYEREFSCPQCEGKMKFVDGVTQVFHTWKCRFRRRPMVRCY